MENEETEKLAFAFGAPVILNANLRDGSLRQAVEEKGVPMLLYEAGEALRFDEFAVRAGVKGILAVIRSIGMLTSRSVKSSRIQPMVANPLAGSGRREAVYCAPRFSGWKNHGRPENRRDRRSF